MAGVVVRIVHHLDLRWSEGATQLFPDRLFDTHANLILSSFIAGRRLIDQPHRQARGCGMNIRGDLL
jgi:hypothetical protein